MKKIIIIFLIALISDQISYSAETNIKQYERAGNLINFDIDQNDNLILFLNNGIISTNDDCKSFKTISKIYRNGIYKLFKNRILNYYLNHVKCFNFDSGIWSDFISLPKNIEVRKIEEINENEYKIICNDRESNDIILYKFQIAQNNLIELFNTHEIINLKQSSTFWVNNFDFIEDDLFIITNFNIFKLNLISKELVSLYNNSFGKIKQGFLKESKLIYFMEERNSTTFLKCIELKNNFVKELDNFSLISDEFYLSDVGEFIKYKMGLTYFYDYKNNIKIKQPEMDIVYNVIKNSKGEYYSLTNIYSNMREILKYDSNFIEIKSNMYYDYNQKGDNNEILINNIQNNEFLIYTNENKVLRTKDNKFLYDDITEKLVFNSEIKRIINDLNNNNYLFSKNGDLNFSEDNGITWSYLKLWDDNKKLNKAELDSNGNFLISTDNGLYFYDPDLRELTLDNYFKTEYISSITVKKDFYIIITEKGIYRYYIKNSKIEFICKIDFLDYKNVVSTVYNGDDIFYIFTKNSGVFKFNNFTGKFIPFNYGLSPENIKCAGLYQDSILITDSEYSIYANKIGTLNWEKLNNKKTPNQILGNILQITQNNKYLIKTYFEIIDSVFLESLLHSYFIQTEENVEKFISRIGGPLFKLSKDNSKIIIMDYEAKISQIDVLSGEILETVNLKDFNSKFYGISGAALSSNDSILVFGFTSEENSHLFSVYYYDLWNHKLLDSFEIYNDLYAGQVYFHFVEGDSLLIVSTNFVNSFDKDYFVLGKTDLYRYNNFEFIKPINNKYIENFSSNLDNNCFIGYNTIGRGIGNLNYFFSTIELINSSFERKSLLSYKIAMMSYPFKEGGYTISNDGKYAIYQNDTNFLPLTFINTQDFSVEKIVEIDNNNKIPIITQSKDGKYYYFANSNVLMIIDANNFKTLEIINYNQLNDSYGKRIKLLEDAENNVIFILNNDGNLFRFNGLKPGKIAVADFNYFPENPKTGDTVYFNNYSTGRPFKYNWSVDNISVSVEKNLKYVFYSSGINNITLIADKGEKSDTISKKIYISNNTGILENHFVSNFLLSPNPASEYIEINKGSKEHQPFTENANIQIFNVFGNEVISTLSAAADIPQEGIFRIDISGLAAGVYFIRIGDKTEKFVKM